MKFQYLNHNGNLAERNVDIDSLEFHHNPGYGYQPGWFISGFDHDKAARRSFALVRIILEPVAGRNLVNRFMKVTTT